ncbi:tetratricopeptide repeat protein 21A [Spea bombifrons]|uniref:tetratricopeptide repeat protein 21A n=1 Tax=Spea bombifrons TaxID=233779 RepID=UPI0023494F73|nr:tetratricopeptide repeat protein 21A [Spea bombifrons]
MAEADPPIMAGIIFNAYNKYYRHVQNLAREGLQRYHNDPVLTFFKMYGTLMEDRVQEAIRELELIKDIPETSVCATMALIYAHKKGDMIDRDTISELESKMKESRRTGGAKALYYAGLFLWLLGRNEKAQEYIDRMLKLSSRSPEGLVLKGWLQLTSNKKTVASKCMKYFEEGIRGSRDIFGMMGKATCFMMQQNYSAALDAINQVIVSFPSFVPAHALKMKITLAQQDWDQTLEMAHRILAKEATNIDAFQILAVHCLAREGDLEKALKLVRDLIVTLDSVEPKNPLLHYQNILVISRLCGKNQAILQEISAFTERAFRMAPGYADLATELANQLMLQGNVAGAAEWYSTAIRADAEHTEALVGVIWCQILQGQLEEAEMQLDFLHEVQKSLGRSKEMCYIEAIMASKKDKEEKIVTDLLNEAVGIHFGAMQDLPLGVEYFEKLNPSFIINVVKEYLAFCPKQPGSAGQAVSPALKQVVAILTPVVNAAPALMEPLYLMAQAKYLAGNLEGALGSLQRCVEVDATCADVHLLMAQIYFEKGQFKECSQSLETGVSYNFQVRDHPLYHLMKARILKKNGELAEAITTLKMTMKLPEMSSRAKKGQLFALSTGERVSVYLELAENLRLNGEQHEATKVMQDAILEFQGTAEEIRIVLGNADLALSKGGADMALSMLRDIAPDQPYYTEVKQKMADIYLNIRKDKKLYIACYRELCERFPGPLTSRLLGDALMKIQEPERALEVYDQAHRKNPSDASLASRIGRALVKTHQYKKAINYYEAAQNMSGQNFLCCDLADLLFKLRNYGKAENVLKKALGHEPAADLASLVKDVKCLVLLGKIYKTFKREELVDTLNKALDIQLRILKRAPLEQPDLIAEQKQTASEICVRIAEHYTDQKDYEKALKYYKEALLYSETDGKAMLELAHLYLIMNDLDSCESQCAVLLQDPGFNEAASMMLADIAFQKQDYTKSIELFQKVLEKAPDNFDVLSRLIDLLRRGGKLTEAPAYFDMSLAKSSRNILEPGFNYCKGLYCWYIGQPNEALTFFNKARKDNEWGQRAISNMIQICLNPDNELVGGEVFENLDEDGRLSEEARESERRAVRTAEKLLKDFHPRTPQAQSQAARLQSYCLMATKDKTNVESALAAFTEMATAEKEDASSILAVAQAYMILKQTPRARNQLKRLSKFNWSLAEAEDLEKSWLLLADVYIKSGKYDMATELLKHCLLYNKSCSKAYEYLGFIMEKEQSYKDAADNYRQAWHYSNQSSPAIGFRLAFNYLKDKRYTDAIDICHKVLKDHPTYPKIQKEILEKAQAALKQ